MQIFKLCLQLLKYFEAIIPIANLRSRNHRTKKKKKLKINIFITIIFVKNLYSIGCQFTSNFGKLINPQLQLFQTRLSASVQRKYGLYSSDERIVYSVRMLTQSNFWQKHAYYEWYLNYSDDHSIRAGYTQRNYEIYMFNGNTQQRQCEFRINTL